MRPPARHGTASVIAFSALAAFGAMTLCVQSAAAQDLTSIASSAQAVIAHAAIDAPRTDQVSVPPLAPGDHGHVSAVMQSLYVTTGVVQGLDAQSTFKALDVGAVESNSLVKPLASNRPAFIALKATMATAFIYAGHDLSKRHRVGAIIALALVNSLYTAIAVHNYHVAHVMSSPR
jgi:hypothetical protein